MILKSRIPPGDIFILICLVFIIVPISIWIYFNNPEKCNNQNYTLPKYVSFKDSDLGFDVSSVVINNSNQIVRMFHETAWRLTDPVFRKIRSFLPNFGGLDISPIIALLIIYFLRSLLREYWPMV